MLTTQLASVASEASHVHFHRRLKLLKELTDYWRNGEEVGLTEIDEGECVCSYYKYEVVEIRKEK